MHPDRAARLVIMASWLYYGDNLSLMSDEDYDQFCQFISQPDIWAQISPLRQWQLSSPEHIRATGQGLRYTRLSIDAAREAYRMRHGYEGEFTGQPTFGGRLISPEGHELDWFTCQGA